MKKYHSHKIVEAAPIIGASFEADGSGNVSYLNADGSFSAVDVPAGFRRPGTEPYISHEGGDYLVRYDDGYLSWSPRDKFEAGYTEIA